MNRMVSRRSALALLTVGAAVACVGLPASQDLSFAQERVEEVVAAGAAPAAGLVVRRSGQFQVAVTAGFAQGAAGEAPIRPFSRDTMFRVASVSKLATALTAHRLARAGRIDLAADISGWLGEGFRHPAFPASPVTLGMLLAHTGGLEDPPQYWADAPASIETLYGPAMWRDASFGPPGSGFRYANFGYGLAATVLERMTGQRFDILARKHALRPLGVRGGFNWSGVDPARRRAGATLYRSDGKTWTVSLDGPAMLEASGPAIRAAAGYDLSTYIPGTNGTLFSPQGGLRASLVELCILASAAAALPAMRRPFWQANAARTNGDTQEDYFLAFSAGAQIHPAETSIIPGVELIGHPGEAYGLYCGAWHAPALDADFAYAVTGTAGLAPARAWHPALNASTAPLVEAAARILTR